jgi:hypothetical protein
MGWQLEKHESMKMIHDMLAHYLLANVASDEKAVAGEVSAVKHKLRSAATAISREQS